MIPYSAWTIFREFVGVRCRYASVLSHSSAHVEGIFPVCGVHTPTPPISLWLVRPLYPYGNYFFYYKTDNRDLPKGERGDGVCNPKTLDIGSTLPE